MVEADVLRLWAAAVEYTEDVRCSRRCERVVDAYRKFRNTLRYALSNLDGFDPQRIRSATTRWRRSICGRLPG